MVGEPVIRRGAHEEKLANSSNRCRAFAIFGIDMVAFHLTVTFLSLSHRHAHLGVNRSTTEFELKESEAKPKPPH
jgi:hypothetical protein